MQHRRFAVVALLIVHVTQTAAAQTAVYLPLGSWVDPQREAISRWDASRQVRSHPPARSLSAEARPQLAGVKPKDVELLEDGLMRKSPKKIDTPAKARKHIIRLAGHQVGKNLLNGAMHEALFIENNPEWGYVSKSNSPQHDVYRWVRGGKTPLNGQLKFHASGDPALYAESMSYDQQAHRFFIPDDHVDALKSYLSSKALRLEAAGDAAGSKAAWRDYGRLEKSRVTARQVMDARRFVTKYEIRQRYSTYTSLGGALALAAGPTIWDWANSNLPANQSIYRTSRALSLLGVSIGADQGLLAIRQGALRGTTRGNIIVGTALLITETSWLLYEHGWSNALTSPDFYESVAGSATGLALGLAAGGATAAWLPGPGWVVGGAAILGGTVAGAVGYVGGKSATHMILEMLAPEKLQQRQRARINQIQQDLERKTATLQRLTS